MLPGILLFTLLVSCKFLYVLVIAVFQRCSVCVCVRACVRACVRVCVCVSCGCFLLLLVEWSSVVCKHSTLSTVLMFMLCFFVLMILYSTMNSWLVSRRIALQTGYYYHQSPFYYHYYSQRRRHYHHHHHYYYCYYYSALVASSTWSSDYIKIIYKIMYYGIV